MVTWVQPWAWVTFAPREAVWGDYYHELAAAAFAEYVGANTIYLATQWGVRYGQGYRMSVSGQGALEIEKTLWLS